MATQIQPDRLFFGAPASLTVAGEEAGTTFDPPKVTIEYETNADKARPQGARGKVKGLIFIKSIVAKAVFRVNEFSASKLGWVIPGASITNTASIGKPLAGQLDTTLAADPALGATNLKVTGIVNADADDFIRVAPAVPTEVNSEVVRIVTVGTAGSGGTGLDIVNDQGGGMRIDHANAEEVKGVFGTTIAADVAAGAVNVKMTGVTGLIVGSIVRFGDYAEHETRTLTVVGTAGAGGTGVTFLEPLSRDHDAGDWAIEVTALGQFTVQPVAGRIPSAAYKDVILTGVGLDGLPLIVEIDDALSVVNQDIPFSDDDWSGFAVELEAYYAMETPTVVPFRFKIG